jgi:hypothetical protein
MEREKANVGEVGKSYVGHGYLDNVLGIDGRAVRSANSGLGMMTEVEGASFGSWK